MFFFFALPRAQNGFPDRPRLVVFSASRQPRWETIVDVADGGIDVLGEAEAGQPYYNWKL